MTPLEKAIARLHKLPDAELVGIVADLLERCADRVGELTVSDYRAVDQVRLTSEVFFDRYDARFTIGQILAAREVGL